MDFDSANSQPPVSAGDMVEVIEFRYDSAYHMRTYESGPFKVKYVGSIYPVVTINNNIELGIKRWRPIDHSFRQSDKPAPTRVSSIPEIDSNFVGESINRKSVMITVHQISDMGFGIFQIIGETSDGQRHILELEVI